MKINLRIKKKSIIKKMLFSMVLALIVQASLFIGTILCSGIIKNFQDNAFNMLNEEASEKSISFRNQMIEKWSNIDEDQEKINSNILNILSSRGLTTDQLNDDNDLSSEILNDVSKDMIFLIRKNNVTGAFIILNTSEEGTEESDNIEKQGLYIKDSNQSADSSKNHDLLLGTGPVAVTENLGIPMDSNWNSKYIFKKTESVYEEKFFYKPINAAKKYKNLSYKDLGYWGKSFKLENSDLPAITYSIPLIDREGNPYGVIGVDITLQYINKILQENKLDSYIIATDTNQDMIFQDVTHIGKIANDIIKNSENIRFDTENTYNNTYEIEDNKNISNKTYGCIKDFNLYGKNTPFEDERWVLIQLAQKNDLLYYINKLKYFLGISSLISILLGILFGFASGKRTANPIINLAKKVRESDPRKPLVLEKTSISEIDELSSAITNLRIKVADSSSKLSQIITLFNMPIGAFEYNKDDEFVFCTKGFLDILKIEDLTSECQYISVSLFESRLKNLLEDSKLEFDDDEVYKIKKPNEDPKWIRLKIKEEGSKKFGVVIDITREILEKRKIEYERDHDVLTNLFNRRAFRKIIINKLQESNLGIGAFVMYDLDNLKYVNDTYGHDCGDEYIREAARILKEFNNYNAIVSRKSGDEFFVFIYGYDNKSEIREIVNQIHEKMKNTQYAISEDKKLKIRASVGIAWYPDDSKDYYELSSYSDFAMYKIKRTVKGNISEYNKDEYNKESFLLKDKEELNKLIEEELVQYAFQPIVDACTGDIYAYEALMRPSLITMRNPIEIIKLATAESKLYQIEKLTWFKSLEAFESHKEEFGNTKIFINSIPNCVLSDKDSKEFQERYGEYSSRLVIEFLENERSNSECTLKKRKLIDKLNAKLAIDDFGSGYNNEATLLDITPDFVKIDMGIVSGIDKDINRQQISKNLISYAKGRGIKVIAEGVETRDELEKLIELGIDYVQGYYLSKPDFNPPKLQEDIIEQILDINVQLEKKCTKPRNGIYNYSLRKGK